MVQRNLGVEVTVLGARALLLLGVVGEIACSSISASKPREFSNQKQGYRI